MRQVAGSRIFDVLVPRTGGRAVDEEFVDSCLLQASESTSLALLVLAAWSQPGPRTKRGHADPVEPHHVHRPRRARLQSGDDIRHAAGRRADAAMCAPSTASTAFTSRTRTGSTSHPARRVTPRSRRRPTTRSSCCCPRRRRCSTPRWRRRSPVSRRAGGRRRGRRGRGGRKGHARPPGWRRMGAPISAARPPEPARILEAHAAGEFPRYLHQLPPRHRLHRGERPPLPARGAARAHEREVCHRLQPGEVMGVGDEHRALDGADAGLQPVGGRRHHHQPLCRVEQHARRPGTEPGVEWARPRARLWRC